MDRRTFLAGLISSGLALSGQLSFGAQLPVKSVTAITEVFGDGQKVSAVAVEYDEVIQTGMLTPSDYMVEGKQVMRVYANSVAGKRVNGVDGRFVIVELATAMSSDSMMGGGGPPSGSKKMGNGPPGMGGPKLGQLATDSATPKPLSVHISQTGPVTTLQGQTYGPSSKSMVSTKDIDLVVRDFRQFVYRDPKLNGSKLMYNLFVPKNYDPHKKYPLVLFIHDAGAVSNNPTATLTQGLGAVGWASPSEQAKQECFVLAPQYQSVIVDDSNKTTAPIDETVDLVKSLERRYAIDRSRIYNTGQSMGGMSSIAMDIKYPKMFAASLLVACQWDTTKVDPLAKQHLWIVVSQGDTKAHPGMDAITAELKKRGATVSSAMGSAEAGETELDGVVAKMRLAKSNVNYLTFENGNHRYTWQYAYSIPAIWDWVFQQRKGGYVK